MLCALHLENIAIISSFDIEFSDGLHVLTGETGAGKSIIIDAINLLLGARGGKSLIRYGENYALCQGLFTMDAILKKLLEENGLPVEDELVLSRSVHQDGKNVCRINGRLVSTSILKQFAPHLINIHGQHDNERLLSATQHIHFLDGFCQKSIAPHLANYQTEYAKLKSIRSQMKSLAMNEKEKEFRIDFLKKQIEEIKGAHPNAAEYETLKNRIDEMENFELLSQKLTQGYEALYAGEGSALDTLNTAIDAMESIQQTSKTYEGLLSRLTNVKYELSDIADTIGSYRDNLDYNPQKLNEWQAQQNALNVLQKKYSTDVEGLITLLREAENDLTTITLSSEKIQELYDEFEAQKTIVAKAAAQLSAVRKSEAQTLSQKIEYELHELNMPKAAFAIQISRSAKFLETGIDEVEFVIRTNEGSPLAPLSKIASGGELSRVMLAMKAVLSKNEAVGTLIFDEIDTGVSGSAGQKIAEKLAKIAGYKQVLCVTHLAQIAAMADTHFLISKTAENGKTNVQIQSLDDGKRLLELSRIMSGLSSDTANAHSKVLLENAKLFKETLS